MSTILVYAKLYIYIYVQICSRIVQNDLQAIDTDGMDWGHKEIVRFVTIMCNFIVMHNFERILLILNFLYDINFLGISDVLTDPQKKMAA